jgi:cell division protein FtsQ
MRALTGLLMLAGLALGAWQFGYWEPRLLPIRVIEVQGELHHHSSEMLRKTIGERLKGGILSADLVDLKEAADGLSWVGGASVRRVWPDRLQVRVEEHKPVGRWNDRDLVTAQGLVFHPREGEVPVGLPTLEGDDRRAPEVVTRYLKWRDDLMLVGHLIQILCVDPRGSWSLDLVSGTHLELGTEHVDQRLERFLANAAQLEAAGQPKIVDLRYSNGFSVTWRRDTAAMPQDSQPQRPVSSKTPKSRAATGKNKVSASKTSVRATASKGKALSKRTTNSRPPMAAQTQTDRARRSAKGG